MKSRFLLAAVAAGVVLCPVIVAAQELEPNVNVENSLGLLRSESISVTIHQSHSSPAMLPVHVSLDEFHLEARDPAIADFQSTPQANSQAAIFPSVDSEIKSEDILVQQNRMKRIERIEIAYHMFNAADIALTLACLNRAGCAEANPLYGSDPDPIVVIGAKMGFSVAYHFMLEEIARRDSRLAEIAAIATTMIQGGVVGVNLARTF